MIVCRSLNREAHSIPAWQTYSVRLDPGAKPGGEQHSGGEEVMIPIGGQPYQLFLNLVTPANPKMKSVDGLTTGLNQHFLPCPSRHRRTLSLSQASLDVGYLRRRTSTYGALLLLVRWQRRHFPPRSFDYGLTNKAAMKKLLQKRRNSCRKKYWPANCNRPIVLLGSGLEAVDPDLAATFFVHFISTHLLCWKQRSSLVFSMPSSPVPLRRLPAGMFFSLTVPWFFDGPMKTCATGGKTDLRCASWYPLSPLSSMNLYCSELSQWNVGCRLLAQSTQLEVWQDQNVSWRKLFSFEHEHRCLSSSSPGCDQLCPSCSLAAQKQPFFFFSFE